MVVFSQIIPIYNNIVTMYKQNPDNIHFFPSRAIAKLHELYESLVTTQPLIQTSVLTFDLKPSWLSDKNCVINLALSCQFAGGGGGVPVRVIP